MSDQPTQPIEQASDNLNVVPSGHARLLDDFLSEPIKERPAIIGRGILPVESKLVIGGRPKEGKSFLAIRMGLDIAEGRQLFGASIHGDKPLFPVLKPSPILYIEKEIGHYSLKSRLVEMQNARHSPPGLPFYLVPKSQVMRLDKKSGREAIEAEIARTGAKVVIIDPLTKFHGLDENSSQEMGAVMRTMDGWMETYGCSFIIVHHTGHQNPQYERKGGDQLRGSTAIYGDVDSIIIHKRLSAEYILEPKIELEFELRHGAPLSPMKFKRSNGGIYSYLGASEPAEDEEEKLEKVAAKKKDADLMESRAMD